MREPSALNMSFLSMLFKEANDMGDDTFCARRVNDKTVKIAIRDALGTETGCTLIEISEAQAAADAINDAIDFLHRHREGRNGVKQR